MRASLAVSLENLLPDAEETLAILAHFDADPSVELLASALGLESGECEDRVGKLFARSLVQRNRQGALRLHALTRSAVLNHYRANAAKYEQRVGAALESLLRELFESQGRPAGRLIEDVDILIAFVRNTQFSDEEAKRAVATGVAYQLCGEHGLLERYGLDRLYLATEEDVADRAVELAEGLDDFNHIARMLHCKASVLRRARKHTAALEVLKAAHDAASQTGDRSLLGSIKCQVGNALVDLNRYPEAEAAMRDGLDEVNAAGDPAAIAQLTGQLGFVLLLSGQLERAKTL